MANLSKGLLSGSDPSIPAGAYGPRCQVERSAGALVDLYDGDKKRLAGYSIGSKTYWISRDLDPTTVPYVNAFIRDHGQVEKYWRTGLYRLKVRNDINITEQYDSWLTSETVASAAVAQGLAIHAAVAAAGPVPTVAQIVEQAVEQPTATVAATFVPRPVVAPTVPPREVIRAKKSKTSVKAPAGFVVVDGRTGPLVLPERTVSTFTAAYRSRFEDGLPAHVIAIGPSGTGKTESLIALALDKGLDIAGVIQCGGIEGPADLYGQTVPDESAPHGWRRLPSDLWRALDLARSNPDKKYFIVLDEVNRVATLSAQNSLLGLLDGSAVLSNPATGEAIPLPDNVMVCATANIGIAYTGTVRMDAALMSRWWTNLVFDYLPEKVEVALTKWIIGKDDQAKYLARAAAELRKAHAQDEFRSALIPGTRELVAVAHQAKHDPEGVAGAWHDKVTASFSNEGRDPSRTEYARVRVISEGVFKAPTPSDREDEATEEPTV